MVDLATIMPGSYNHAKATGATVKSCAPKMADTPGRCNRRRRVRLSTRRIALTCSKRAWFPRQGPSHRRRSPEPLNDPRQAWLANLSPPGKPRKSLAWPIPPSRSGEWSNTFRPGCFPKSFSSRSRPSSVKRSKPSKRLFRDLAPDRLLKREKEKRCQGKKVPDHFLTSWPPNHAINCFLSHNIMMVFTKAFNSGQALIATIRSSFFSIRPASRVFT